MDETQNGAQIGGDTTRSKSTDTNHGEQLQEPQSASDHAPTTIPPYHGEKDGSGHRKKFENHYLSHIENGFVAISMPSQSSGSVPSKRKKAGNHPDAKSQCSATEQHSTASEPSSVNATTSQKNGTDSATTEIPETVLQYQRQLRKTQAAKRASTPLPRSRLPELIVHDDDHLVVVNKPSGVLTVPGIHSNPSLLSVVHEEFRDALGEFRPEHMIVHRLDMDTSGLVIFAKNKPTLLALQALFREREGVSKHYEAVVCGHLDPGIQRGSIDLPLQRDHRHPPFMRVATPASEREAKQAVKDLQTAGFKKLVKKNPKPSRTLFEVVAREYVVASDSGTAKGGETSRHPVTRLELTPITGRTHQLRVHCAAMGHPILGDPAYGIYGEAAPNGGLSTEGLLPSQASVDLELALDGYVRETNQVMCLHARELRLAHPVTGDTLVLQKAPSF